jgi:hypothetical protein
MTSERIYRRPSYLQYGPHPGAALNRQLTCAVTKPIRNREALTAGPSLA